MATDKKGILARARAAARETTAVTDEGLRAYMLKVYNYMATGILLTGIIALITFKMSVVTDASGSIVALTEVGLAEISVREKSGLLAYSPLAFGYLTGKYRNNNLPEKSRMKLFKDFTRYKNENGQKAIEEYYKLSQKFNIDFTQMSLKFCEIQPFMTSVIIGATTIEQLKTNIESVNVSLTSEILNEINKIQKMFPNPCP